MELDKSLLEKITLLDDDTLRQAILGAAEGMGIDPKMASMYLSDMGKIKEGVMNFTQEDLNRVESALGKDATQNLIEQIKTEVKDK